MFGIFDYFKFGAGALVGALLAYQVGHWRGRSAEQAAARTRAMELIQQRSKDNAEISSLDAARLCGELGGRWVPDQDRCD